MNVFFNLQNKTIFNYFPFPWTVSAVHVVVGLIYCVIAYAVGAKKASFGRVCTLHACSDSKHSASAHLLACEAARMSEA